MSYPAGHTSSQHAPTARDSGRRRPAVLAALAALLILAAVGCASIAPTLTRTAQRNRISGPGGASTRTSKSQPPARAFGLVTPPPHGAPRKLGRPPVTPGGPAGLTTGSALFGGNGLVHDEGRLGRTLAIVRIYDTVGQSFESPMIDQIMAAGSTLLVSLDTKPGGPGYASIASGHEDGTISRFLRQMNQAAIRYHLNAIYICFEHEANVTSTHNRYGTPAEFIRAWDHVRHLATAAHLNWRQGGRLHWVLIMTHPAYEAVHLSAKWPGVSAFWPGRDEVDIVGVDGYNTGNCRSARPGSNYVASGHAVQSPADLFDPALRFARAHGGMPVFVAEWASVPYQRASVQPGFIRQMQGFVTANREIHAALYWNAHGAGNGCNYIIDNRRASMSALAAMGHTPGLQARARMHG
jgi:hypothetical protein